MTLSQRDLMAHEWGGVCQLREVGQDTVLSVRLPSTGRPGSRQQRVDIELIPPPCFSPKQRSTGTRFSTGALLALAGVDLLAVSRRGGVGSHYTPAR